MTSESYQFGDISGTYTLNYGYNLSGELTSLSIPFTSQSIGYNHDSSGRLSSVSASGFSASNYNYPNSYTQTVSSFISDIQYRAWGAAKNVSYGNTVTESTGYNARLLPTTYTAGNVNYPNAVTSMSWTYDYYDDGRLQFAHDLTENKWDRSFAYDHAARLREANTNSKARGQAASSFDPYNQTMAYDVWGNTTNRTGSLYTGEYALNDSASYANNRRQYWGYDASGNVTIDASYNHTFDAVGRSREAISHQNVGDGSAQFPSQPQLEITQTYDGDGASRKRVQIARQNIYDDWNENHPLVQVLEDTQTSYYVKSSVLGGARTVELDANGNKKSVWIYAGGQRIAKEENGSVTFEHHNPATGGWLQTNGHSSFRTTTREERDIRNAEIPLTNPYPTGSYISMKWEQPLLIEGGDPFDPSSGYEIDGLPVSAAEFERRTGNGSVGAGIFFNGRQIGFVDLTGRNQLRSISFDVFRVPEAFRDLPEQWTNPEFYRGVIWASLPDVAQQPQRTPQKPVTVPLTTTQLKGLIQDRLNYGDCADYVKKLISQAAKMAPANNPPNQFKDVLDLFDQIVAQPKGGFKFEAARGTSIGTGSGSAGGYLVRSDATMTVTPVNYYANSPSYIVRSALENAPYRYGITGLHEVIHHAGRYRYDDDFLTRVARSLEPDANISYWDHALQNHCLPANRRYNYDYTK